MSKLEALEYKQLRLGHAVELSWEKHEVLLKKFKTASTQYHKEKNKQNR